MSKYRQSFFHIWIHWIDSISHAYSVQFLACLLWHLSLLIQSFIVDQGLDLQDHLELMTQCLWRVPGVGENKSGPHLTSPFGPVVKVTTSPRTTQMTVTPSRRVRWALIFLRLVRGDQVEMWEVEDEVWISQSRRKRRVRFCYCGSMLIFTYSKINKCDVNSFCALSSSL